MVYQGIIRNGRVELEPGASIPDGTCVEVQPVGASRDPLDGICDEAVDTGITDLAAQHDHYLYGVAKRSDS
ncbi:MAG: hypothetical protein IT449_06755 [Phycisphaerales bacterium]|nr:hypothetical protein [Phycisphaerales bacterium]